MAGIERTEAAIEETVKLSERFSATPIRGSESWQFFAFMFAVTVTFSVAVIEELPPSAIFWIGLGEISLLRLGLKVLAFVGVGYATLINRRARNSLVGVLDWFKRRG